MNINMNDSKSKKIKKPRQYNTPYYSHFGPMLPDRYYHLYTQGNNGEIICRDDEDYQRILNTFIKKISPFAHLLSYIIMPNHIHFTINIKQWEQM